MVLPIYRDSVKIDVSGEHPRAAGHDMHIPTDGHHHPDMGPGAINIGSHSGDWGADSSPPSVPPPMFHAVPSDDRLPEKGPLGLLSVVFFAIFGLTMIAIVVSGSQATGADSSVVCLFVLFLVAMIVYVVARHLVASKTPEPPEVSQEPDAVKEVRVETVRETVKVRCRYCGTLNLETDTKCRSCGGNL